MKSNNKEQTRVNPGPWSYDESDHCLVDINGNVIAEFYEDDENGNLVAMIINKHYFNTLRSNAND